MDLITELAKAVPAMHMQMLVILNFAEVDFCVKSCYSRMTNSKDSDEKALSQALHPLFCPSFQYLGQINLYKTGCFRVSFGYTILYIFPSSPLQIVLYDMKTSDVPLF